MNTDGTLADAVHLIGRLADLMWQSSQRVELASKCSDPLMNERTMQMYRYHSVQLEKWARDAHQWCASATQERFTLSEPALSQSMEVYLERQRNRTAAANVPHASGDNPDSGDVVPNVPDR